jgi:trigger factor
MKTSLEKTGTLGRKLKIEVPAAKVTTAFDRIYQGIQKQADIKGFRKGKAPMHLIKNMYSDRVKQDVLQDLIAHSYSEALKEHSLNPISQPDVNFDGQTLTEKSDFHFTAEFEVRPNVELKKIDKLKVEKEILDISDVKIESVLTQIRESKSQLVPIFEDRPAQLHDVCEIDFKGTINGAPLEGGQMDAYKLELGSNSFIPGFEDGIIGMKVGGNKTLKLKFPDDYGHKEIAGQAVEFDVTLKSILKKDLPELNDAWVAEMNAGAKTVSELKELIKKDITSQEDKRIQDDLKNRLLKSLAEANPTDVPQTMLLEQKNALIKDVEKRLKSQGMNEAEFNDYTQKWDKDFSETATFMVQSSFLIDAISKQEKLNATREDIEKKIQTYAAQSGIELDKIKDFYLKNEDRRGQIEYQITEEKVVSYLLSKADIKEVSADKLAKK